MPIFMERSSALPPPRWPHLWAVGAPWGAATLALLLGAVVAAWVLRRAVVRPNGNGGAR
jgi:hypothetical protein